MGVGVDVCVGVGVFEGVNVAVGVGVFDGVNVVVGVSVLVGVKVGVDVGLIQLYVATIDFISYSYCPIRIEPTAVTVNRNR